MFLDKHGNRLCVYCEYAILYDSQSSCNISLPACPLIIGPPHHQSSGHCVHQKPDVHKFTVDRYQQVHNESYIFSTYLDRRINVIRAFGAVHYNFSSHLYYCLLWYESEADPEVTRPSAQHYDHWYEFSSMSFTVNHFKFTAA